MGTSVGMSGTVTGAERTEPMPTVTSVAPATRAWLAVAALGAGLLHAALAPSAPLPALIVLVAIGAAELTWAAMTFARERPPLLQASLYLALLPVALWATVASAGAATGAGTILALQPLPLAVASGLDLAVAATVAVVLRRRRPARDSGAVRFVLTLLVSAAVVSGVTIPALGLTSAGLSAVSVHLQHSGHH